MKKTKKTHKKLFVKMLLLMCFVVACVILSFKYIRAQKPCDFFRNNQCLLCAEETDFPTGYKENCEKCPNRKAYYIEGGLIPAWSCILETAQPNLEKPIEKSVTPCPKSRPLKDIVGNCHTCATDEPVHLFLTFNQNIPCHGSRYLLPDNLTLSSLKCPLLENITDPEACLACQGFWQHNTCLSIGENIFCQDNDTCPEGQWCFPLKANSEHKGLCVDKAQTNWICSQTDGYDLETAKTFCTRQNAHIPTLEEIEQANEDLSVLCPALDVWTFFSPDGAVWLESFALEFIFTREGESQKLGGRSFYALCHQD